MENSYVIFTQTNTSRGETYFTGLVSDLGNPQTGVDLERARKFDTARKAYEFARYVLPKSLHGSFQVGRRPESVKLPPVRFDHTKRAVKDAKRRAAEARVA